MVNETFKQIRLGKGLKQKFVAQKLGVEQQVLSRFENGCRNDIIRIKLSKLYNRPDLAPDLEVQPIT